MKKPPVLVAAALSAALLILLSACGTSDPTSDPTPPVMSPVAPVSRPAQPTVGVPLANTPVDKFFEWLRSGTYSYEYSLTSDSSGAMTSTNGSLAVDGENIWISMSGQQPDGSGASSTILVKGADAYFINDEAKTVMKAPATFDVDQIRNTTKTFNTEVSKDSSGVAVFNGKEMPYDEYLVPGTTTRFYYDGDQVLGAEIYLYDGGTLVMQLKNVSNTVNPKLLELPQGYQVEETP